MQRCSERREKSGYLKRMQQPTRSRVPALLQEARLAGYTKAFVVGVAVFGIAFWWLKHQDGVVTRGAEVMAVLPFTTSGEGANYLAEGIVDLLAINLGEIDAIRTANSRIVFRLHRDAGRPGGADLPAALAQARSVDAGSVLTGSVRARGADLEVSAELHRTDGRQIAEARVKGSASGVLALVDDLSEALIRDLWRSREAVPGFDVSSVTTSNVQALSHYLRGEALFRRGQWRAAASAFTRAVRADTTFALAYSRLSDTYGWADGIFTESATFNTEAAHRFAERLPTRQRRLVMARWQAGRDVSDRATADSLRALLARYPDDLEALHLLAEIGFHQRPLYASGLEDLTEPVERLLALDSTMTAGLIHPIESALQFGDQARFERYLGMAEATGLRRGSDFRRVGTALWHASETREAVARELMADVGSTLTYAVGSYRVDVGSPADFRGGLDAVIPLLPAERATSLWSVRAFLLTSTGRMAAAADTARLDVVPASVIRAHLTDYPAVAGFINAAEVTRGLETRVTGGAAAAASSLRWETRFSQAVGYLAAGDTQRGEAALDELEGDDPPTELESVGPGLLVASRGWVLLLRGDTAAAIERMQSGLTQAGRWTPAGVNTDPSDAIGGLGTGAALAFRLVAAMASWAPTAEQGRRLLRNVLWPDFHYEVLRHYELGRALEQAGERERARESYNRFLRLLEGADEGLLVEDEMARAREASARLVETLW